jgi:hypothetical protein
MITRKILKYAIINLLGILNFYSSIAQEKHEVKIIKSNTENKIDIFIGNNLFTSFLYPDTLEKPVLYPVIAPNHAMVTRGFPLNPQPGDPIDHPHHSGIWFNFENVNGLDFWNNSYAIPKENKHLYGWIKTDSILETSGGVLSYHANWINKQNDVLLEETTRFTFSGNEHQRIIDRQTVLKANTDVLLKDAKDGMLGIRLAHALQLPTNKDEEYIDNKGNVTIVKGTTDTIANGNYISSEGKQGDSVWSTRARWCKIYGRMENDSISVSILDHPSNPNYPTFWHARGYGLFAANPLGEQIFTNGISSKNLTLKKGESITFNYRIIISAGKNTISAKELNESADAFAKSK